ncbi:lipid kinase YegS [Thermomonas carbonis]|uniref:Probable lipid kinase YegS-like n=1 Tax=Thermomonas carbonis TaxID=1463158 RepID=A0A7G9SU35_9GAMM|nr:lipid kinase YegS [Thermomonas carbonis]QNN71360.1 lipid kinase YegS [Thermomonas carbonis]GHC10092.1 putative lipid kinase YegS-like protein [Thermomonas carbonis]
MTTSTTPRWRLILNGKSAGDDDVREAVAALRDAGVQLDVRVTWEAGDAERYVAEAIDDGIDTIVAGGGDGTLSEVATTLAHRDESADALPTLGLLPLGTANDFARAAGIPDEPEAALRLLLQAPATPIDLLKLDANGETHWAANLASGGFGTQVTTETHEGLKKLLGGLAYVLTGLSKLGRIEPLQARVQGPGFDWEGDFIALGIGNGRQAGGGQALCPDALVNDGLLDVTIVPPLEGDLLATFGTAMTEGKDAALDRVAVRRVLPWVEIQAKQPLTLNLDGEPVEAMTFRIECMPHRLRMHLPADCPLRGNPAKVAP